MIEINPNQSIFGACKSHSETYATYVRRRRQARSVSEAKKIIQSGSVKNRLQKFEKLDEEAKKGPERSLR